MHAIQEKWVFISTRSIWRKHFVPLEVSPLYQRRKLFLKFVHHVVFLYYCTWGFFLASEIAETMRYYILSNVGKIKFTVCFSWRMSRSSNVYFFLVYLVLLRVFKFLRWMSWGKTNCTSITRVRKLSSKQEERKSAKYLARAAVQARKRGRLFRALKSLLHRVYQFPTSPSALRTLSRKLFVIRGIIFFILQCNKRVGHDQVHRLIPFL